MRHVQMNASRLVLLVSMLALAMMACSLNAPEQLNDGSGTRENPVPFQKYAATTNYEIRAQGIVRPMAVEPTSEENETEYMRVQFQVRCTMRQDEVCNLDEIRPDIKVVDSAGVIYDPFFGVEVENMLAGEILADAENAGWLAYEVPRGLDVPMAVVEYGEEFRVFIKLQ